MDIPTYMTWDGVPVTELPRDVLEREFVAAHQKIRKLEEQLRDQSVEHIKDLAAMRVAQLQSDRTLVGRFLDRIIG